MGQAGGQAGSEWLISAQHREYLAAFRDNYSPVHVPVIAQHFSVIKATRGTALSFNPIAGHPPIDNPESSTTYFVTWSPTPGLRGGSPHCMSFSIERGRDGEGGQLRSLDALCKWRLSTKVHRWVVETIATAMEIWSWSICMSSKYCTWTCEADCCKASTKGGGTVFADGEKLQATKKF